MTFQLLDVVTANVAFPDSGVTPGMLGTIVEVYSDGEYEVEFCDDNGVTLAMVPMTPSQFFPYSEIKTPHERLNFG
jgi:hypothetical protein